MLLRTFLLLYMTMPAMMPRKSMEENILMDPYLEYMKLVFCDPYSCISYLEREETSMVVFLCNLPRVSSLSFGPFCTIACFCSKVFLGSG